MLTECLNQRGEQSGFRWEDFIRRSKIIECRIDGEWPGIGTHIEGSSKKLRLYSGCSTAEDDDDDDDDDNDDDVE